MVLKRKILVKTTWFCTNNIGINQFYNTKIGALLLSTLQKNTNRFHKTHKRIFKPKIKKLPLFSIAYYF